VNQELLERKSPMHELTKFENCDWQAIAESYVYVTAAGFESRACCGPKLVSSRVPLNAAFVLEFREHVIPENQSNLTRIVLVLEKKAPVKVLQIETVEHLQAKLTEFLAHGRCRVLVDVTAMTHAIILRALASISAAGTCPLVSYTEADEYYPRHIEAKKYLCYPDDERAFHAASTYEHKEVMYAGLSSVGTVKGFEGRILPTAPTTVILFPTFKRLRTAAILAELEVNSKVFMLGVPVRADLKWRERALRVINHDLINEDTDVLVAVDTLSPLDCYTKLNTLLEKRIASPRGNIVICPHGSKMQTVAVWRFCTENPDVRVVLAHPKEFFPKKYSLGHRDTFVFDPSVAWKQA
jgi:hypothetical protein